MENPINMDDFGGNPLFSETPILSSYLLTWVVNTGILHVALRDTYTFQVAIEVVYMDHGTATSLHGHLGADGGLLCSLLAGLK